MARFLHRKRWFCPGTDHVERAGNMRQFRRTSWFGRRLFAASPTKEETLHNATKYGVLLAVLAMFAVPHRGADAACDRQDLG